MEAPCLNSGPAPQQTLDLVGREDPLLARESDRGTGLGAVVERLVLDEALNDPLELGLDRQSPSRGRDDPHGLGLDRLAASDGTNGGREERVVAHISKSNEPGPL